MRFGSEVSCMCVFTSCALNALIGSSTAKIVAGCSRAGVVFIISYVPGNPPDGVKEEFGWDMTPLCGAGKRPGFCG